MVPKKKGLVVVSSKDYEDLGSVIPSPEPEYSGNVVTSLRGVASRSYRDTNGLVVVSSKDYEDLGSQVPTPEPVVVVDSGPSRFRQIPSGTEDIGKITQRLEQEKIGIQTQEFIDENIGSPFLVEYRDVSGDVKKVSTQDIGYTLKDLGSPGGAYGEVFRIHRVDGGIVYHDPGIISSPTIESQVRQNITWSDVSKDFSPQQRFLLGHTLTGYGFVGGDEAREKRIKTYKSEYEHRYEDVVLGKISESEFESYNKDFWETRESRLSDKYRKEYYKTWGEFNGKSWVYYEKQGYQIKMEKGRPVVFKPVEDVKPKTSSNPFVEFVGDVGSYVFNPYSFEYAKAGLLRSPGDYSLESPEMVKWREQGEMYYEKAWDKKSIKDIGLGVISSPIGATLTSVGIGYGIGSVAGVTTGHSIPLVARSGSTVFSVTPATAVNIGMVGVGSGVTAAGLKSSYDMGGWSSIKEQFTKTAVTLPFVFGGYKIGYGRGFVSGSEMKTAFSKVYSSHVPKNIQSVFSMAKGKVLSPSDIAWGRRWSPHVVKTYFGRSSPKSIQSVLGRRSFSRGSSIYRKDLGFYGHELYPYAVRSGVVRDVGRASVSDLSIPYSGYASGSWWSRPEDIVFMPHKPPESSTYVFNTKLGTKFYSVAKDRSSYSIGEIKPLGAGKKDFNMFVSGRSYQKVYSTSEGPLGTIPSVKKQLFYGIVGSDEVSLHGSRLSSDWVGMKQSGSFRVFTPSSSVKGLSVFKPISQEYSFGGRLFKESYFVESMSLSRQMGGSVAKPGRWGFSSVDMPEYGFGFSRSKVDGMISSSDVSISMFPPKPKASLDYSSSISSFVSPKSGLVMPGGIGGGVKMEGVSFPKLFSPQGSLMGSRVSLGYLEGIEGGIYSSGFWRGSIPVMGVGVSSIAVSSVKPMSKVGIDSMVLSMKDIQLLNNVSIGSVSGMVVGSIQSLSPISKTGVKSDIKTSQVSSSALGVSSVSVSAMDQVVRQSLKLDTSLASSSVVKPISLSLKPSSYIPHSGGSSSSRKVYPPVLVIPDSLGVVMGSGSGNGFNVFVKDRYIFHGKKTKPERFVKVNRYPLSRGDALGLGGSAVDNSSAASFKIKPTGGVVKPLGLVVDPWSKINTKYNSRQTKKGLVFVEKNKYRIDTKGEVEGVSALGWIAKQKKSVKKDVVKSRRKTSYKKVSKKSEFDIGFGIDKQIENKIKKILRGSLL